MKSRNVSAMIAAVALVGAGSAQAQHHNMHPNTMYGSYFAGQQAMHGGHLNYTGVVGANGTGHAYYRPALPTNTTGAINPPVIVNNNSQFVPAGQHHNYNYNYNNHSSGLVHGTTGTIVTSPSTPIVGNAQSALANVRQEVRVDKMAVHNDQAMGNTARLQQDQARLQTDLRTERQLERQGVGGLNTNSNGFLQNGNTSFIQGGNFNSGTVLSERELRRQNYSALHANYKTRNNNTDIVRMPVGGTDRVHTAGAQRAARNVP